MGRFFASPAAPGSILATTRLRRTSLLRSLVCVSASDTSYEPSAVETGLVRFMNQKRTNPVSTADGSYDVSEAETQTRLLKSEVLLSRVVARMDPGAAGLAKKRPMATSGWRSWRH